MNQFQKLKEITGIEPAKDVYQSLVDYLLK